MTHYPRQPRLLVPWGEWTSLFSHGDSGAKMFWPVSSPTEPQSVFFFFSLEAAPPRSSGFNFPVCKLVGDRSARPENHYNGKLRPSRVNKDILP